MYLTSLYLFPAKSIKDAFIIITKYQTQQIIKVFSNLFSDSTIQFPLVFRQAENYPVDLYFIMDVSHTMSTYKEALGNFAQKLGELIIH